MQWDNFMHYLVFPVVSQESFLYPIFGGSTGQVTCKSWRWDCRCRELRSASRADVKAGPGFLGNAGFIPAFH